MREKPHSTEGIVLHAIPYRDHDRLLTVLTLKYGLLKLVMRGTSAVAEPLTRAEFTFSLKEGRDMATCREVSIMNHHYRLREKLDWLQCGCDIAFALKSSQLSNHPIPQLYELAIRYLEKIPVVPDVRALSASFYLKVLRHDGIANFGSVCSDCNTSLSTLYFSSGECYCREHAPQEAFFFKENETNAIQQLAFTRSFKDFLPLKASEDFHKKIQKAFATHY